MHQRPRSLFVVHWTIIQPPPQDISKFLCPVANEQYCRSLEPHPEQVYGGTGTVVQRAIAFTLECRLNLILSCWGNVSRLVSCVQWNSDDTRSERDLVRESRNNHGLRTGEFGYHANSLGRPSSTLDTPSRFAERMKLRKEASLARMRRGPALDTIHSDGDYPAYCHIQLPSVLQSKGWVQVKCTYTCVSFHTDKQGKGWNLSLLTFAGSWAKKGWERLSVRLTLKVNWTVR